MCEKCKNGGNILDGYLNTKKGKVFTRLRFDLDNNQFDMQYGIMGEENTPDEFDWTNSIDISFCPFCGKRLTITTTVADFTNFINRYALIETGYPIDRLLSFISKNTETFSSTHDSSIMSILTNIYKTEVTGVMKTNDIICINFKKPNIFLNKKNKIKENDKLFDSISIEE